MYTPSMSSRQLFPDMQRNQYLENDCVCLDGHRDSFHCSNFWDVDWLSSSRNSCEEETYESVSRVLQKWCRTRTGYLPGTGTRTGTAAHVPDTANSVSVRLGELVRLGYAVGTPGYGRTRCSEHGREETEKRGEKRGVPGLKLRRLRRPSIDL
ncbi:unnamed protein product [Camellia sinensis]